MKPILFTLALIFTSCAGNKSIPDSVYPAETLSIPYHSEWTKVHYHEKIGEFKKFPLAKGDVVFLGNSITEEGGNWGKRLGWDNVRNRGISGDVTEGVLRRLGEITYTKPKTVFLLIGINDLFTDATTPEYVANNIFNIVAVIRKESPDTKLYVQTILPTTTTSIKGKIQRTNELLRKKATVKTFILQDIHSLFADNSGLLKKEYTRDGVHLNEDGYRVWGEFLKEQIQ